MLTAILVDGQKNPVAITVDQESPFINFEGSPNRPKGSFRFVRKQGNVLVYRSNRESLTDEAFEEQANLETDKILNPEKYKEMERAAKAKAQKAR